mgnify:FL=1
MNKTVITINGIRAAEFKVVLVDSFNLLNGLLIMRQYNDYRKPYSRIKITIKPRHTKFKYPVGLTLDVLKIKYACIYISNNRVYKFYILKDYLFGHTESEITRWINNK